MIPFEEVKQYLPKYLSPKAEEDLFRALDQFPKNIDQRIYTSYLCKENIVFQGDGIQDLLFVNLPEETIRHVPGMILSNTCDIDLNNKRLVPSRMVYAPIINLAKYEQALIKNHVNTGLKKPDAIKNHISNIKKQFVSHVFYLPKGGQLYEDSIVFFDRLMNCSSAFVDLAELPDKRIFTLSDYGFYLFLFKVSVHFTRIREGVVRTTQ